MAQLSANIANVFRAKGSRPISPAAYLPRKRARPMSDAEADRRFDAWAGRFPEEAPAAATQPATRNATEG